MARGSREFVWASVFLLSGFLHCGRCEMKKSWKVKTSIPDDSADLQMISSQESSHAKAGESHFPAKMLRFEDEENQNSANEEQPQENPKASSESPEQTTVQFEESSSEASNQSTSTGKPKNRLRSTYIANRTSSTYHTVRESAKAAPFVEDLEPEIQIDDFSADDADDEDFDLEQLKANNHNKKGKSGEDQFSEGYDMIETILEEMNSVSKDEEESKNEASEPEPKPESAQPGKTKDYDFGPVLNMTIDEPNNIVKVKLNEKVLKDMFTGRQVGGGNKKMWKYAVPLFILPFLIQSAIIPFMLTTVKLFLFKSFMAGKLAIFLLLLGAFKNFSHKREKEVYVKDLPERRYEPYSSEWPYPYHNEARPGWATVN
ncbi:uncharacterized protein LOC129740245 [Uranotaenia lowii]|uniref:uncharacterized protein LOC129740245 n=1 Tax=Uranotaenia lowii TaxID=190385 RepID=UPI002478409A|nr:uncharacterized protein LOC129740245 [Uranotaenia lowii]